jgi:hypothetical protein
MGSWIRMANADPKGNNQPKKEEKLNQKTRKNMKFIIFYAVIF